MRVMSNNTNIKSLKIEYIKKCRLDETWVYTVTTKKRDLSGNIVKQKKNMRLIQQTDYMFVFETLDNKRLKEIIYKVDYVLNKKLITKCPNRSVKVC